MTFAAYTPAPDLPASPGPPRPPAAVRAAIVGIALVIAISLASMLWELGHLDGFRAQIRSQYAANPSPGVSERAYEHSAVMILVVALLVAAVLVVAFGALVCNFLWRGRQWARVIAFICGGLGMLGGPLALVENASTGARLVQGLSALLDLGIVIALAMEDSSHFFRSRKQHKQEAWNQRLWEQREEARRAAPPPMPGPELTYMQKYELGYGQPPDGPSYPGPPRP